VALVSSLAPLRERPFRRLFFARSVSLLGDNVAPIALAFAVFDLGGSASALGLVLAARAAPLVGLVLAGGVWADRLSRKRLMIASDLVRCTSQGLLAILLIGGGAELWMLVVLAAANGAAAAFYHPAASGLIPQTVSRERLQEANALLFFSVSAANIVGPVIGGALVATVGTGWAIGLDAASFALSALLLSGLAVHGAVRIVRPFVEELRDGWSEVRSRTWLWVSISNFALFQLAILSSLFVLGPLVAKRELGGAGAWAAIAAGLGVGLALGSVIALRYRPARPLATAFASVLSVAVPLALLAVAAPTPLIVVAMVCAGTSLGLAQTLWSTVMQRRIPEHALSRVSSYDWLGSSALRPLGYAAIGPLAGLVGVEATLLLAAGLVVVLETVTLSVDGIRRLTASAEEQPTSDGEPGAPAADGSAPAVGRNPAVAGQTGTRR
jgi:MFS family permease